MCIRDSRSELLKQVKIPQPREEKDLNFSAGTDDNVTFSQLLVTIQPLNALSLRRKKKRISEDDDAEVNVLPLSNKQALDAIWLISTYATT